MERVFEALGEPRRRAILEFLIDGERSAGEVVEAMQALGPASQPTISQHLKVLREAGLVVVRAEGTRRVHAIDPSGVAAAQAWLRSLVDPLDAFTQPLDALTTEVARGKRARPGQSGTRSGSSRNRRTA